MIICTTPKSINKNVKKLCEKIGTDIDPVYVKVIPEHGCLPNECFPNVQAKIKADGGSLQHGWTIWETPKKLIEGEFHGVWVDEKGDYIDITPKPDGEKEILFIPDNKLVYKNEPIDNIRLALSNDPAVLAMIQQNEKMTQLRKKYNNNGQAQMPAHEVAKIFSGGTTPTTVSPKIGRNSPCPCGSGKKYKKCCAI